MRITFAKDRGALPFQGCSKCTMTTKSSDSDSDCDSDHDRGKIDTIVMHQLGQWLLFCSIIGYFKAPAAGMGTTDPPKMSRDQKISQYSK